MQRFSTWKPVWQGAIAAAVTVAAGLLILACCRAVIRAASHEPDFSLKVARNVEWQTWSTTVAILTRGVVSASMASKTFGLLPDRLGGPYENLSQQMALVARVEHPRPFRLEWRAQRQRHVRPHRFGWPPERVRPPRRTAPGPDQEASG